MQGVWKSQCTIVKRRWLEGEWPKKKFLQDLETIRSMILQNLACKITMDFGTISREIMPE